MQMMERTRERKVLREDLKILDGGIEREEEVENDETRKEKNK